MDKHKLIKPEKSSDTTSTSKPVYLDTDRQDPIEIVHLQPLIPELPAQTIQQDGTTYYRAPQPLTPQVPPQFIEQGGIIYYRELHPNEIKIQQINETLEKKWRYWCYKYINLITIVYCSFCVVGLIAFGIMYILYETGFMNNPYMREQMSIPLNQYGAGVYPWEFRLNLCSSIFRTAFEAYQSNLVFRAMNRKDVTLAKQAVKMMRIYMILRVIERFWILIEDCIMYPPNNKDEFLALLIFSALEIILNLARFTSIYYFGASKVYKLLTEADKLKSVKAQ